MRTANGGVSNGRSSDAARLRHLVPERDAAENDKQDQTDGNGYGHGREIGKCEEHFLVSFPSSYSSLPCLFCREASLQPSVAPGERGPF